MKLDQRIEVGSQVLVNGDKQGEVVEIDDDRLKVTVKLVAQPDQPPLKLGWGDVKLPDQHL